MSHGSNWMVISLTSVSSGDRTAHAQRVLNDLCGRGRWSLRSTGADQFGVISYLVLAEELSFNEAAERDKR